MGSTTGFLSFNKKPPQLHICGEDTDFDPATLRFFRDEAFAVHYHTIANGRAALAASVAAIADDLELGEHYAIVAYGTAATACLQLAQKPMPRLCAMVAYYPDLLPAPNAKYPSQLPLVMHLAGAQAALGGSASVRHWWYRGTDVGFAEMDVPEYEPVAAGLAWSRTLGTVRKGFGLNVDLEGVWEEHLQRKQPSLPSSAQLHLSALGVPRGLERLLWQLRHAHSGSIAFFILLRRSADEYPIARAQTSTRPKTRPRPWPQ